MGTKYKTSGRCIAFQGTKCVGKGTLLDVAIQAKQAFDADPQATFLVFDDESSEPVEVDLRGTVEDVTTRIRSSAESAQQVEAAGPDGRGEAEEAPATGRAPGRPKLGVVAREVTLLPRHWDWLSEQPGGASVTLRKLVEEARRSSAGEADVGRRREACYRFMNAMAGNEPGFEEALRALYAGEKDRFAELTDVWPADVRDHVSNLAMGC